MPIHPATIRAFKAKGYEHGETDNQWTFVTGIEQGAKSNHASFHYLLSVLKEKGEQPREFVPAAKRVIDPATRKEHVLVTYAFEGTHFDGTTIGDRWLERGRHALPIFRRTFNGERNRWEEGAEVIGSKDIYEYPWEGTETKIEDLSGKKVLLTKLVEQNAHYYVMSDKKIKLALSKADFFNLSREELLTKYDVNPTNQALSDLTNAISRAQELTK